MNSRQRQELRDSRRAEYETRLQQREDSGPVERGIGNPKHDKAARRRRGKTKTKRVGSSNYALKNHGTGTSASAQANKAARARRIAG